MPLNLPLRDWNNQRVWVIGASTGIGAATAQILLQRGAQVAFSARNETALAELAQNHERALVLPFDATRAGAIEEALRKITAQWGGVDLVLFVIGTHKPMRAWELDARAAHELIEINLLSIMDGCAAVIPQLLKQGSGGIGIVASVGGYRGLPVALIYGPSKAALINFVECLYLDLAPKGINIYLINPGFVKTPLSDKNEFKMPALVSAEEAAREIITGMEAGKFEIHFPKRFTRVMKLLRILPYRLYFYLVRKSTGL
ncbi:MAG: SDR family NAD(P)-dependent oxidoreductase [Burkholderiales bacterium]